MQEKTPLEFGSARGMILSYKKRDDGSSHPRNGWFSLLISASSNQAWPTGGSAGLDSLPSQGLWGWGNETALQRWGAWKRDQPTVTSQLWFLCLLHINYLMRWWVWKREKKRMGEVQEPWNSRIKRKKLSWVSVKISSKWNRWRCKVRFLNLFLGLKFLFIEFFVCLFVFWLIYFPFCHRHYYQ